jgi:hypothetical protein
MSHANTSRPQANEPPLLTMRGSPESEHAISSSTFEQSTSHTLPHSSGTLDSTRTNSSPEDEQNQIIHRLESTIDSFRNGNSTKMNAIASVLKILGENSNVSITESQKEVTFDSYLTEILSIQSTLDQSGKLNVSRTDSNRQPTGPRETSIRKHARRSPHEMDPESEDDDDKPSKKSKLLKSDMPWLLQLQTMCYIEPVPVFSTEQDIIVNSCCLSSKRSQRSSQTKFDELHKECHLRKWYCLSEFENEFSR